MDTVGELNERGDALVAGGYAVRVRASASSRSVFRIPLSPSSLAGEATAVLCYPMTDLQLQGVGACPRWQADAYLSRLPASCAVSFEMAVHPTPPPEFRHLFGVSSSLTSSHNVVGFLTRERVEAALCWLEAHPLLPHGGTSNKRAFCDERTDDAAGVRCSLTVGSSLSDRCKKRREGNRL